MKKFLWSFYCQVKGCFERRKLIVMKHEVVNNILATKPPYVDNFKNSLSTYLRFEVNLNRLNL